jgi:hypothetical protein
MTVTPEVLEPTSNDDVAATEPRPRRRHVWGWVTLAVVLLIVAAGTTFIVRASTKNVVGWNGGVVAMGSSGVIQHQDPFGAEPGNSWAEIKFQPGATLKVGFSITNLSHTQTITIRSVTFDGVANSGDATFVESAISKATLDVDYNFDGGDTPMQAFHSFRLPARQQAVIQWTLTMCPSGTPSNGGDTEFSSFEIDYTYFGVHRHQTLPLVQPLQIDNPSYCA